MTRTAWLPLLFVLIAACGEPDGDCKYVAHVTGRARGTITVDVAERAPSASGIDDHEVEVTGDGRVHIKFDAAEIIFTKPVTTETHDLSTLDGELCTHSDCVALEGSVLVHRVDEKVLDASLRVDGQAEDRGLVVHAGSSHVFHEVGDVWQCDYDGDSGRGCATPGGNGSFLR